MLCFERFCFDNVCFKKQATGGKMRLTDITDMENFFRLIQSVLCVLLKENHYLYPDIE